MRSRSHYLPARHRLRPSSSRSVLIGLFVALLALGSATAARPVIVATLHPYADLLRQIVGDRADVVQLLPSGASPHTFDPTPSQARSIAGAALVVMNGGVDAWATRLVASAAQHTSLFVVTQSLPFDPIQGSDGAGANPHVWLDASLMAALTPLLVKALSAVDPVDAASFEANGASVTTSLKHLDDELAQALAPLRGAPFVPFHDGWPYFARRYGLDLIASIEPAAGREPSPRTIAEAVAIIRRTHAKAVFDERQLNPRPAQVVAEAAGVPLVPLDPLGDANQRYQELMRANVRAIVRALTR